MAEPAASLVPSSGRAEAIATVTSAFLADPVERWLYPDADQYLTYFPVFVRAFAGPAFEEKTVWQLDDFAAVALWLPPGAESNGEVTLDVLSGSVAPALHDDLFAVLGLLADAHPTDPHWYLPWFGVDTARQGSGLGSRLLAHCLTVIDATHQPAYLESTNPRNVAFYERHGFAVIGTVQVGAAPPMVQMSRAAR